MHGRHVRGKGERGHLDEARQRPAVPERPPDATQPNRDSAEPERDERDGEGRGDQRQASRPPGERPRDEPPADLVAEKHPREHTVAHRVEQVTLVSERLHSARYGAYLTSIFALDSAGARNLTDRFVDGRGANAVLL